MFCSLYCNVERQLGSCGVCRSSGIKLTSADPPGQSEPGKGRQTADLRQHGESRLLADIPVLSSQKLTPFQYFISQNNIMKSQIIKRISPIFVTDQGHISMFPISDNGLIPGAIMSCLPDNREIALTDVMSSQDQCQCWGFSSSAPLPTACCWMRKWSPWPEGGRQPRTTTASTPSSCPAPRPGWTSQTASPRLTAATAVWIS